MNRKGSTAMLLTTATMLTVTPTPMNRMATEASQWQPKATLAIPDHAAVVAGDAAASAVIGEATARIVLRYL
ncbi:MAG: hypothetical protein H0V63_00600 [Burkholderiaceae bacterium]|nr:hypothetical protein [Burkholderiaceae bacterium]